MKDVFNREPIDFVDQNEQFPILDENVGLTHQQFRTLVENTNYLKNNLGLSSIEVTKVKTEFPSPGSFSDVIVEHLIDLVNGKPVDSLGFLFKIPTPRISASLTNEIVDERTQVGMQLVSKPIVEVINNAEVVTGYEFEFHSKLPRVPMYYLQYSKQDLSEAEQTQARANINAGTSNFSGNYNDLLNKPTLSTVARTGKYNDLIDKPNLSTVATTGLYSDLLNKPRLTAVATSGDYNDLVNKPTKVSQFENDKGYLTSASLNFVAFDKIQELSVEQQQIARTNIGAGTSNFNGDYNTLINKPTIPTKTSDLTNDNEFVTKGVTDLTNYYTSTIIDEKLANVSVDLSDYYTKKEVNDKFDTFSVDLSDYYTITQTNTAISTEINKLSTVAKTGKYTDLIDLPTIPTKLSDLTNDTNFIDNTVTNLTNYYDKETINGMISSGGGIKTQIVDALPEVGDTTIIYLLPSQNPETSNLFEEYIYINNAYEMIGSASLNLDAYYTSKQVDDKFALKTSIPTKTSNLSNDSGFITSTALENYYDKTTADGKFALITSIPKNTSDIKNDSGFITNSVDNLTNYYTITQIDTKFDELPIFNKDLYYTKTDTDTLLGNLTYVSYDTQTLTNEQKTLARTNIGAGTSSFSGNYNDLSNLPTIDTTLKDSDNAVQNRAIFNKFGLVDKSIEDTTSTANNAYSTAQDANNTSNSINTKLNSLTLVDNKDNTYTLKFKQDNVEVGTITMPTDYVDDVKQSLVDNNVIFSLKNDTTNFEVDLKPYVYTAGNGISSSQISDTDNRNKISVLLDTTDENNKLYFNTTTRGLNVNLTDYINNTDIASVFKDVSYNATTGVITFTKYDNSTKTIDLPLELLIESGRYDATTKELVLVLANKDTIKIPVADMLTEYYADNTTLELKDVNGQQTFNVKDGVFAKAGDLPTITLNGSVIKNPSFYAPTSVGTDGYFLKSTGNGTPTWAEIPKTTITIDDALSEISTNPVQNRVVAENINKKFNVLKTQSTKPNKELWVNKSWNFIEFEGSNIWTDGQHIYYSAYYTQKELINGQWVDKTWNFGELYGEDIWTDGQHIYYSYNTIHKELINGQWVNKDWNFVDFNGFNIWTDRYYIYYSNGYTQKELINGQWVDKTWNFDVEGSNIWTDGQHIYYNGSSQRELINGQWIYKEWHYTFEGSNIWTDGQHIYYSDNVKHKELINGQWVDKYCDFNIFGNMVWTDGQHIYYSKYETQKELISTTDISPKLNKDYKQIPTKTSDLENDSGFLTSAPSNVVTTTNETQEISGKKTFKGTIIVPDIIV